MQSSIINHSGDCTNGRREKDVNHLLESRRHARNNAIGRGQKQQRRVRTGHSCVLLVAMANRSPVSFFPPSYNRTLSADNVLGDYVISLLRSLAAGMAKEKKKKKTYRRDIQSTLQMIFALITLLSSVKRIFFFLARLRDQRWSRRRPWNWNRRGWPSKKKGGNKYIYILFSFKRKKKEKKRQVCRPSASSLARKWVQRWRFGDGRQSVRSISPALRQQDYRSESSDRPLIL